MSVSGFIIGIGIFIFCLFLTMVVPTLSGFSLASLNVLQIFFLFIGFIAIFVGAIEK